MKKLLLSLSLLSMLVSTQAYEGEMLLKQAHKNYLKGNTLALTQNLHSLLTKHSDDPVIKKNALDLYTKARETHHKLKTDWEKPEQIERLEVKFRSGIRRDKFSYSLQLQGVTANEKTIQQLKLTQYPNNVLLDKRANIGYFESEFEPEEKLWYNVITTDNQANSFDVGLYLFELELEDGTTSKGWFIIDESSFSHKAPVISSPAVGETLRTKRPTFKFLDFKSPNYNPDERRSFYALVSSEETGKWKMHWQFWESDPSRNQVEMTEDLSPGKYTLYINFQEKRKFGELSLSRKSRNLRHFYIK